MLTMNGWINLYKHTGISSAKALGIIKRAFRGRRVGHSGTLDLEAEGILPVAIGAATKLIPFLQEKPKTYKFTIQFGARSDTADSYGKIIERTDIVPSSIEQCAAIIPKFLGKITQNPPQYSALKVNGQRAYDLALKGQEFTLPTREVSIYSLELLNFDNNKHTATYIASCSKGTYVRSLAEDIAFSLQSLGFVLELARLEYGPFNDEGAISSITLKDLPFEEAANLLRQKLMGVGDVLDDIPAISISEQECYKIRCGQLCHFSPAEHAGKVLWLKHNGEVVAFGMLAEDGIFKTHKVLHYGTSN